jgi:hypothetical protein
MRSLLCPTGGTSAAASSSSPASATAFEAACNYTRSASAVCAKGYKL